MQPKIFKSSKFIITILSLLSFIKCESAIDYLDTTFGPNYNGIVTTDFDNEDRANAVGIMSNGKIVAAGTTVIDEVENIAVSKYNTDGTLDTSFATSGKFISLAGSTSANANAVAIDGSNNILLTGSNGSAEIIVMRLTSSGSVDNTFGTSGIATLSIGDGSSSSAIRIDANSKVVVAGTTVINGQAHLFVARFNSNGTLDTTFNSGGTPGYNAVTGSSHFTGSSLTIDGNAKLVAGGSYVNGAFLVARFNSDGTLDTSSFNSGGDIPGTVTTEIPDNDTATVKSVLVDGSNDIIAAGYAKSGNTGVFALVKYDNDGSIDTSFGTDGIAITNIGTNAELDAALLDLDGKIVGVGLSDDNLAAARYNANGSLDTTFGTSGILTNPLGSNLRGQLLANAVQSDGRIVAAGTIADFSAAEETSNFIVLRYNKNNTDFVNITSIADNSTIDTKIPTVSGTSSGTTSPQASVQVIVNGVTLTTVNTDNSGNWNAGQTNVLPIGQNIIRANLIINSTVVVSHVTVFTVEDNLSEDAVFAYNTTSQTKSSGSSGFSTLPFDNTPVLGTWTYSSNVFTCNVTGRYFFSYMGEAGVTSLGVLAAGLNIAMMASFATPPGSASEYTGSASNTNVELVTNLTSTMSKGFIKDLAAGDTVRLNYAVTQVTGGNSTAGLIAHPNSQGSQYPYSLAITRIG